MEESPSCSVSEPQLSTAWRLCEYVLEYANNAINTFGRLVWRLFRIIVWVARTEFLYLSFSFSTCFFKTSNFVRFVDNGCLGLNAVSVSSLAKFPVNLISISVSEFISLCNFFSSFSVFFRWFTSSSCCRTIDWTADRKLLMASKDICTLTAA